VARHERSFSRYEQVLDLEHYLDVLECKPGALVGSSPLKQWRERGPTPYSRSLAVVHGMKVMHVQDVALWLHLYQRPSHVGGVASDRHSTRLHPQTRSTERQSNKARAARRRSARAKSHAVRAS
jgi:hypothetical protein